MMQTRSLLAAFATRFPRWAAARIFFVIALAVGLWGWTLQEPPVSLSGWLNNLFRTIQLITLQFPTDLVERSLPWQLQIARLTVPISVLLVVLRLLVRAVRQGHITFQHSSQEPTKRPTPQPRGSKIFISYRRLDTSHIAGRVYDRLAREIPEDEIFFDVDTIPIGVNFKRHISSVVSSSAVMLVLVGEKWLSLNWKRSQWRFGSKPKEDFRPGRN